MGRRKQIPSSADPRKVSAHLPYETCKQMALEGQRLDRSVSWVARRAWDIAKGFV